MGLLNSKQPDSLNTDITLWRRKTLDLLFYIAALCSTVEMGFLFIYFQTNQEYSSNLFPYLSVYLATLFLTIFKRIGFPFRAIGLTLIVYSFGLLELFSTGLTGDGRVFLLAAPVIALLLSGTRACQGITVLSLLTYIVAGFAPYFNFVPVQFIPQEATIGEYTWITSGIIFATVLIGLVTLVWKFANLNSRTSQQNNRLTSESKSLREITGNLQAREAELQALLSAIGDKVLVIDDQGRILKTADGYSQPDVAIAEAHRKNILRILPQPQASEVLDQIQEALDSNQTRVIDYCINADGRERWFSGTISPFEAGKVVMVSRDITESIKSTSRERDQRTLANALKSAASLVNSPLDINEVLMRVLAAVGEVVSQDAASIILVGERGKLSGIGRSGLPGFQKNIEYLDQMNINDLQTLRTMKRTGNPLLIPDISLYPAWVPMAGDSRTHSYLGCPIKIKGKVTGYLSLESMKPGFYSQEHIDKLQSFVDLAATAIENANLQRETQKLAISDELTGLFNRRGLMDLGRREVDRARRFHHPLSAAIMDLDNFKSVNDTYGHVAGDQLLNQIADCCRASFREIDIIGRYGGDEIVVLLIENDIDQAYQVADRSRQTI
ncbi:MAG TPA: diguanylate cyclase, partial [Leptolinea sp.]